MQFQKLITDLITCRSFLNKYNVKNMYEISALYQMINLNVMYTVVKAA